MTANPFVRLGVLAVIILAAASGPASAGQSGADPTLERIRVKAGNRVTVDLANGLRVEGRFLDATADALTIATESGDRRLASSDILRIQRHKRGVLLGAIIGTGVGLACGAALGSLFASEGHDRDGPLFGLTAFGLGAGLGIDAALNIPRTVYQRSPRRTAVTFDAAPHRAAIGVVVAF